MIGVQFTKYRCVSELSYLCPAKIVGSFKVTCCDHMCVRCFGPIEDQTNCRPRDPFRPWYL